MKHNPSTHNQGGNMKEPTLKEMRELVKFRRRVKELLEETPSYDAETILSARQVGQQLDELRRGLV
ncbi:MAG TPA: hypothetical protein DIT13_02445, partial [Verrucomicrobiales bacterium]|nr:hypothetical protein [Verrucomicrobiales bacterium]